MTQRSPIASVPKTETRIPYTDFPFEDIDVWAARDEQYWVLMLPSEY
ncbi:DUF6876 family protein [Thalassoglobus sp.]